MTDLPSSKGLRPPGETWIWFTSLGLAIGLLMVAGLLGLIVRNGVGVFWPKPVVAVELKAGSISALAGTNILAGLVADTRIKRMPLDLQSGEKKAREETEWHLLVANRDAYGLSFRYVNTRDIVRQWRPPDAMIIERMEYGPAIGEAVALVRADGSRLLASEPKFAAEWPAAVARARALRAEIRELERIQIGRINFELERLRLAARSAGTTNAAAAERREQLERDYALLAAKATKLREDAAAEKLDYRLYTGATRTIPVSHVVGFHQPNAMGVGEKLGHFFGTLWRFISDEPREANTEGGIFPAIFGTFVMTLLMSLAVTPFGVLAAIYLREYARQGLFVRCVRISVNNLAGVPSIVFGVFGLGFFVYVLGGSIDEIFFANKLPTPTFGTGGILWAALTLALMTVPVVIVATEEALAAVPRGTREGSLALGASKWQTISRVVMPASAPGILTGLVLAMARGAGEVAPLMLVGVVKLAPSLPIDHLPPHVHLDQKFMHLGFHIYDLGFQSPDSDAARPMVFATTLFLILLIILLNLGAIIVRERLRRKYRVGAF